MLLSDFNKVMPLLKNGFFVKWMHTNEQNENGWYCYETFADRYDFKKIQVIKCKKHFSFDQDGDIDFELWLKKIEKPTQNA